MMKRILAILGLVLCTVLRAASLPVSFNTATHKIAAPLDLWTVNSADIYNGLGLAGMSLQSPSSVSITGGSISGVSGLAYTANPLSQFSATTSAQLAGVLSDETGSGGGFVRATYPTIDAPTLTGHPTIEGVTSTGATGTGALVYSTAPTFVTPVLGVATATSVNGTTIPSSKTLVVTTDKLSALAATTSSELASVLSDKVGTGPAVFATSPTLTTPTLGTPTQANLANATNLPISTGVSGLGTGVATALATPSSYNIFAAVTDETGSGSLVGSASPTFTGQVTVATGSAASPSLILTGTSSGLWNRGSGVPGIAVNGSDVYSFGAGTFIILNSGGALSINGDTIITRGAAGRLDQRNLTSAQSFRVYNTYSDSSNGEWFAIDWQSVANECLIGNYANGLGSANRALSFTVGGTRRWQINGSNYHLYAMTDNAYDIGASAANRPRTIYAGTSVIAASSVQVAAGAWIGDTARSIWRSPSDGVYTVSNHGETDFDRIQYGGTSSSFPAHKRNGTTIETKLADNSGFAATQSLYDRFGKGTPEGAVTAPVGAVYHRTDGGAGTSFYVKESGTGNTGWVAK